MKAADDYNVSTFPRKSKFGIEVKIDEVKNKFI